MKCPIDQTDMEKGILYANGQWWKSGGQSKLVGIMFNPKSAGGIPVTTHRCPKCGKVELTTEVEENK